jgi:carboxymethylenebutenolidase
MDRVYAMELVRAFQVGQLTRREFVNRMGIVLGGFAAVPTVLAACSASPANPRPVVATPAGAGAPPAPTAGNIPAATTAIVLRGEMVTYPGPGGQTLSGYYTQPENLDKAPGVIVIQEWWGLNDQIKGVADRLAAAGYTALAPDLYHGTVTTEPDEARKQVMALDQAAAVKEITAAGDYLLSRPDVAGPKVGVMGFCMGGMLALRTALSADNAGAIVAFYGKPLTPDESKQVKAPILGLYGSKDQSIPVADIQKMADALTAAGVANETKVYDGAQHAFFNEQRPDSYDATAAADAWERTLAWFKQHLNQG